MTEPDARGELLAGYIFPLQVVGACIRDANGGYVAELSSPLGGDARDAMLKFLVESANERAAAENDALVDSVKIAIRGELAKSHYGLPKGGWDGLMKRAAVSAIAAVRKADRG